MFKALKERLLSSEMISEKVVDVFSFVPPETPVPFMKLAFFEENGGPVDFKTRVAVDLTICSGYKGELEIRALCEEATKVLEASPVAAGKEETLLLKFLKRSITEDRDGVTRTALLTFEGLKRKK